MSTKHASHKDQSGARWSLLSPGGRRGIMKESGSERYGTEFRQRG